MQWVRILILVLLAGATLLSGGGLKAPLTEASAGYMLVNVVDTNDIAPVSGGASYIGFGLDVPPSVNNAAEVAFQGTSGGPSFASGLFKASPTAADTLVALEGSIAPGTSGGTFNPHFSFGINDAGDVAFWDGVTGGSYSHGIFLATSGGITARVLAPNGTFDGVGPVCGGLPLNASGQIAFYGTKFMGGLNYQNGIYLDGAIIAQALNQNYAIGREALNDSGQVAFFDGRAMVGGGGGGGLIAEVGGPAPGTGGGTFSATANVCGGTFIAPVINNAGEVAFPANVQNGNTSNGIFSSVGGVTSKVVLVGDLAPGGGTFVSVRSPSINDLGDIAFWASKGSYGVFVESEGTVTPAAVDGEPAPDTGGGTLNMVSSTPDINNLGEIAFPANVSGGTVSQAIFLAIPTAGDHDADGVANASDNCMFDANPTQANADGDAQGDACDPDDDNDTLIDASDNCPTVANLGQENTDGDQWGDACELCPTYATAWMVGPGDGDCDGFTDGDEGMIGTDAADPCADTPGPDDEADDRWPSDFDDSQVINISDVFYVLPPYFGTSVPPTSARRDLAPDGVINISDVFKVLPPYFGWSCT